MFCQSPDKECRIVSYIFTADVNCLVWPLVDKCCHYQRRNIGLVRQSPKHVWYHSHVRMHVIQIRTRTSLALYHCSPDRFLSPELPHAPCSRNLPYSLLGGMVTSTEVPLCSGPRPICVWKGLVFASNHKRNATFCWTSESHENHFPFNVWMVQWDVRCCGCLSETANAVLCCPYLWYLWKGGQWRQFLFLLFVWRQTQHLDFTGQILLRFGIPSRGNSMKCALPFINHICCVCRWLTWNLRHIPNWSTRTFAAERYWGIGGTKRGATMWSGRAVATVSLAPAIELLHDSRQCYNFLCLLDCRRKMERKPELIVLDFSQSPFCTFESLVCS